VTPFHSGACPTVVDKLLKRFPRCVRAYRENTHTFLRIPGDANFQGISAPPRNEVKGILNIWHALKILIPLKR
jgi:hypothetical protein